MRDVYIAAGVVGSGRDCESARGKLLSGNLEFLLIKFYVVYGRAIQTLSV